MNGIPSTALCNASPVSALNILAGSADIQTAGWGRGRLVTFALPVSINPVETLSPRHRQQ